MSVPQIERSIRMESPQRTLEMTASYKCIIHTTIIQFNWPITFAIISKVLKKIYRFSGNSSCSKTHFLILWHDNQQIRFKSASFVIQNKRPLLSSHPYLDKKIQSTGIILFCVNMVFSLTDDAFYQNILHLSETAGISAAQLLTISTQDSYT